MVIVAINHFFFFGDGDLFVCLFSIGQRGSQRNPGSTRSSWLDSKKNDLMYSFMNIHGVLAVWCKHSELPEVFISAAKQ